MAAAGSEADLDSCSPDEHQAATKAPLLPDSLRQHGNERLGFGDVEHALDLHLMKVNLHSLTPEVYALVPICPQVPATDLETATNSARSHPFRDSLLDKLSRVRHFAPRCCQATMKVHHDVVTPSSPAYGRVYANGKRQAIPRTECGCKAPRFDLPTALLSRRFFRQRKDSNALTIAVYAVQEASLVVLPSGKPRPHHLVGAVRRTLPNARAVCIQLDPTEKHGRPFGTQRDTQADC